MFFAAQEFEKPKRTRDWVPPVTFMVGWTSHGGVDKIQMVKCDAEGNIVNRPVGRNGIHRRIRWTPSAANQRKRRLQPLPKLNTGGKLTSGGSADWYIDQVFAEEDD